MWSKHYLACLYLSVYISIPAQSHLVFSSIDTKNGLSENRIRNIQQLEDGRMVINTEGVTNIYFVFRGDKDLFNFDWWRFSSK